MSVILHGKDFYCSRNCGTTTNDVLYDDFSSIKVKTILRLLHQPEGQYTVHRNDSAIFMILLPILWLWQQHLTLISHSLTTHAQLFSFLQTSDPWNVSNDVCAIGVHDTWLITTKRVILSSMLADAKSFFTKKFAQEHRWSRSMQSILAVVTIVLLGPNDKYSDGMGHISLCGISWKYGFVFPEDPMSEDDTTTRYYSPSSSISHS